ncbi:TPA: hypothetical protein QEM39_003708 [Pseudomonas putida]|uniref:putative phage abortive infection protein n=1 Tax=Pseudomonas putida TaxID=303 RepID=UPI002364542E|nr:putative phage abortive infection protein [Pseudomonas putida]MDD2149924.1 putative phage abortive infection protein [Pseudomonas putida]HDS1682132.1 hypothetical protein [Pseudomonas putida]
MINYSKLSEMVDKIKSDFNLSMLASASVAIVVVLIFYVFNFFGSLSSSKETWGQFGDYVGGLLNPLLSFLALIAVVRGLRYQSEELKAARSEASTAIDMQREQTSIFKQQSFEALFFALIDLHSKSIEGLRLSVDGEDLAGHDVLRHVAKKFSLDKIHYVDGLPLKPRDRDHAINVQVKNFMEYVKYDAFECFRCLEQILSYVEACPLDDEDLKKRYALIVQAALSSAELECVRIYAMSPEGAKLKALQDLLIKPLPELYMKPH